MGGGDKAKESQSSGVPKYVGKQANYGNFVNVEEGSLTDHYEVKKVLGSGAFGEVRLCEHKDTGEERAVKTIKKNRMKKDDREIVLKELEMLKEMDHPNIIKVFEVYEDA